jgi:hypothetical protein
MLLLGVVQAQAAGAPAGEPAYDLLATTILTTTTASVTFSSLGDYASDYQHLQVRFTALQTGSGGSRLYMRINGQTSYYYHDLLGNGSTVSSQALSLNGIRLVNNISTTALQFTGGVVDILDPFEAKNKTIRCLQGTAGSQTQISLSSGLLNNTSAITSLAFATGNLGYGDGGSLASGTRLSIYGLRK